MYAQLSETGQEYKRVIQVGDESVGITPAVINAFPHLFVDLRDRTDYPETAESVWYNATEDSFTTECEKPEPTPEPPLSETEQAILDTAINVDYLVCMKELEI